MGKTPPRLSMRMKSLPQPEYFEKGIGMNGLELDLFIGVYDAI